MTMHHLMQCKDHLKKHDVKVGDRWENASHKAYNSKIVYTVEDANDQISHYQYSITVVLVVTVSFFSKT